MFARGIAPAALGHMHRLAVPFGISNCHFGAAPRVINAPIASLGLSSRHVALLPSVLVTAQDVFTAHWTGALASVKGLGNVALKKISDWANANRKKPQGQRSCPLNMSKKYESKKRWRHGAKGHRGRARVPRVARW